METSFHPLCELFAQLGLPATPADVDRFVQSHRPLPAGMALHEAPFWSDTQAEFLRDGLARDADWSALIDGLALALQAD